MNGNKNASVTAWTDPDDAPELTDAFFEEAGGSVVSPQNNDLRAETPVGMPSWRLKLGVDGICAPFKVF